MDKGAINEEGSVKSTTSEYDSDFEHQNTKSNISETALTYRSYLHYKGRAQAFNYKTEKPQEEVCGHWKV